MKILKYLIALIVSILYSTLLLLGWVYNFNGTSKAVKRVFKKISGVEK